MSVPLTKLQSKRVSDSDDLLAASCGKKARLDGHEAAANTIQEFSMGRDADDDVSSNSSRETLESGFSSLSGSSQRSEATDTGASLFQAVVLESAQKGERGARRRRQTIAQAVARPRRNRRRGCLEVLLNMPVEIFCEVSSRFNSIA